jgi:hypothetical protein
MSGDLYFYPIAFNTRASALAGPGFSYAPASPKQPAVTYQPAQSAAPKPGFAYEAAQPAAPKPSANYAPPAPPQLAPASNHLVLYAVVYTNGAPSFSVEPHGGGFLVSRIFENANVSHLIVVVSDHHAGTDPKVVLGPTHTVTQDVMQLAERGFSYRWPRKSPRETRFYFIRVGKSIMYTQDPKGTWHLAGALDFHVCETGTSYNDIRDTCVRDLSIPVPQPHVPMFSQNLKHAQALVPSHK